MDNVALLLDRLGWRWQFQESINMETGLNLLLPISPFSAPFFRYYERGGGVTIDGRPYGGVLLCRMVTAYLQGSY